MNDPHTDAEWQEAVDAAKFWIVMDSCKQYGLIEWDGAVNMERCEEILKRGAARKTFPRPLDELIRRYIA